MKQITVLGLWHLGTVTAAGVARFHRVIGLDFDLTQVQKLNEGIPPIAEPGLEDLVASGIRSQNLSFSCDPVASCQNADLLWVADDTPVSEEDVADVHSVLEKIRKCIPHLKKGTPILISSQLPVGTYRQLVKETENRFPIAISPENLRLGKAVDGFLAPDRLIVGVSSVELKNTLLPLLENFTKKLIWMKPESAEMVKHSLNGFLALSISYINEIARICEYTGASAKEVEEGLKSDPRIGYGSYLHAGAAFAGGTLARDTVYLTQEIERHQLQLPLIPSIRKSNEIHRQWSLDQLRSFFPSLKGISILILGLTYKPGTDTLRRSHSVQLTERLLQEGAVVQVWDPAFEGAPPPALPWANSLETALSTHSVWIFMNQHPHWKSINWSAMHLQKTLVLDAGGLMQSILVNDPLITYCQVGESNL